MVDVEKFKKKIEQSLTQEYKIEFFGNNFEKNIRSLTNQQFQEILMWVKTITQMR